MIPILQMMNLRSQNLTIWLKILLFQATKLIIQKYLWSACDVCSHWLVLLHLAEAQEIWEPKVLKGLESPPRRWKGRPQFSHGWKMGGNCLWHAAECLRAISWVVCQTCPEAATSKSSSAALPLAQANSPRVLSLPFSIHSFLLSLPRFQ